MLVTFLDETSDYAQYTPLIFGTVKEIAKVFHRTKNQMRRRKFHLKNMTNIWKHTVFKIYRSLIAPSRFSREKDSVLAGSKFSKFSSIKTISLE